MKYGGGTKPWNTGAGVSRMRPSTRFWPCELLRRFSPAVRQTGAGVGGTSSTPITTTMLFCSIEFRSVTPQPRNSQLLAGWASALSERAAGQVGRPLFEVLEFQWTVPEPASQW